MPRTRFKLQVPQARRLAALAAGCALAFGASQAQAQASVGDEPDRAGLSSGPCWNVAPTAAIAFAQPPSATMQAAKSAAILGGQPSALELIRSAQQGVEAPFTGPTEQLASAEPSVAMPLAPASGAFRPDTARCGQVLGASESASPNAEDFLASKRLQIRRTSFDGAWQRVGAEQISSTRYRRLLGPVSGERWTTLNSVNQWVNRSIAFTEDQALFSRADFWAGARRTLALGRGDCEDIALTKMQLLAAAGIPREDMVLTIARDLVRNADHAVLIVRHEGRYFLLDNASDQILDASVSHDYRPILSFSSGQTWLHGY